MTDPRGGLEFIDALTANLVEAYTAQGLQPGDISIGTVEEIAQFLLDTEELMDDWATSDGEPIIILGAYIYWFTHRFHDG